jgi:hypothetical protein
VQEHKTYLPTLFLFLRWGRSILTSPASSLAQASDLAGQSSMHAWTIHAYMLQCAKIIIITFALCNAMHSKELNWESLPVLLFMLFGRRRRWWWRVADCCCFLLCFCCSLSSLVFLCCVVLMLLLEDEDEDDGDGRLDDYCYFSFSFCFSSSSLVFLSIPLI